MKKLIIVALALVGMAGYAQDQKDHSKKSQRADMEKMTPEQRTEKRVERMTKELNLGAKQQEQLKKLYLEQAESREAKKEVMKEKKDQAKEKMEDQRKVMDGKVSAILTPEQLKKWKISQDKMKERMQQRRANHQDGGSMEN